MSHRIASAVRLNLVAWLALFVALGGTSLAASHYVITSTKQIKPSVLKQLHGKSGKAGAKGIAGPQGPAGPQGVKAETGPEGKAGASAGLSDFNNGPIKLEAKSGEQTVATMSNLPAGNYILNAKVTVGDENELTALEIHCYLRAGSDFDEASASLVKYPGPGNVETLPLTVGHTFASTGAVTLTCNNSTGLILISVSQAKISAVQVQTLTRTSG
jgi:hypothetical protein